jgi:hypothetical protein
MPFGVEISGCLRVRAWVAVADLMERWKTSIAEPDWAWLTTYSVEVEASKSMPRGWKSLTLKFCRVSGFSASSSETLEE